MHEYVNLNNLWSTKFSSTLFAGPSDDSYEILLEILSNRLEDGLGETIYEVGTRRLPLKRGI